MSTIQVKGMTCGGCVRTVERILSKVEGVEAVRVDLASGRVEIDGKPSMEEVVRVISNAGYEASA